MTTTYRQGPETARLFHRALTPDDAGAFFRLNSDPDVMRYTGERPLMNVQAARAAIVAYPDFDTVGYGRWGCVEKSSGALIGFCGLKYLEELDEIDVGYRFLPAYWGQGLAAEACAASIAFGFDTLKLPRIIALVLAENTASIRVLEKCGLSADGDIMYEGDRALRYAITAGPRPA